MPRVMLFARRPRAGRVKTRLARQIGESAALQFYRAFLWDQLAFLEELGRRYDVELWLDGRWESSIDGPRPGLPIREQGEGDLGRRLARGVARADAEQTLPAVVLGADAPTLPRSRIDGAIERLGSSGTDDLVVEPATDGGYVMLALRRHQPALFEDVPWGGARVLETTLRHARALDLAAHVGEGWYDIDDVDGLERLRIESSGCDDMARAPHSAAALLAFDRRRDSVV